MKITSFCGSRPGHPTQLCEAAGLRPPLRDRQRVIAGLLRFLIEFVRVNERVTEASFDPARITIKAGLPARLTFTRTSDKTCATAVVFPALNIQRDLPLNQPVVIEFTPAKAGNITFTCGVNMLKGAVAVTAAR